MIIVYRQPQKILLAPSTHAVFFSHYWPSSSIKHLICKNST